MQGKVATSEFQHNRVYRLEPLLETGRGYDSTALSGSHTWTAFVRRECFGGGAREADGGLGGSWNLSKLALGTTLQEECERCWGGHRCEYNSSPALWEPPFHKCSLSFCCFVLTTRRKHWLGRFPPLLQPPRLWKGNTALGC